MHTYTAGLLPLAKLCISLFLFLFQEGWCDRVGSVQEIQAKLLKRQEAAAKRERAMAYALANQVRMRGLFFQGHVIGHFVSKF